MYKKLPDSVPLPEDSTERLNIRITPSELEILKKLMQKKHCNLSQAARLLMFTFRKNELKAILDSGLEDSELLKISEERGREFRDAVKTIERYIKCFDTRLSECDSKGSFKQEDLEYANKALESVKIMCGCLSNVAKAIETAVYNEIASRRDSGTPPSVIIIPDKNAQGNTNHTGNESPEKKRIPYKYLYMQTIEIIGKITQPPENYSTKNGTEMIRFVVTVPGDTKDPDNQNSTPYTVYFKKTGVVQYLVNGKRVLIKGDFKVTEKNEKPSLNILADNLILL